MSVQDSENRPPTRSAVKFDILLEDKKPNASAPKRVSEEPVRASVSLEELERKQKEAKERRKAGFCMHKLASYPPHNYSVSMHILIPVTVSLSLLAERRAGKARQDPPNRPRDQALLPGHCAPY